jgi:hypothetical protein
MSSGDAVEGLKMSVTKFEVIVIKAIELAGQGPLDTHSGFVDFSNRAALEAVRLSDQAWKLPLREYFESLPEEQLLKLQTVMYVGRDRQSDIRSVHRAMLQHKQTKEDLIRTLSEKPSLGAYLARGWEILLNSDLDPEGPF